MFTEHQCVERIDPASWEEACSNYIVRQHSNRYIWAAEVLKEAPYIADIACGVGYGTAYLAKNTYALRVLGIDREVRAIKHAMKYFNEPNIIYICDDLMEDRPYSWPAIVCFETIEHLDNDKEFVKNLYKWSAKNGQLLISAPNETIIPLRDNPNGFHYRHYTLDGLTTILKPYFEIQEVKFQNRAGKFVDKEDMIILMQCIKKGEKD